MNTMLQFRAKTDAPLDGSVLQAAVEACPTGFAVLEAGRIAYANQGFVEMLGFLYAAEIEGRHLRDFLVEPRNASPLREGEPAEETMVRKESRTCFPSGELLVARRDNSHLSVRCAGTQFSAQERDLVVVTVSRCDLERQASSESEKLAAMGRLASGVAHDFNNLLTGILLYCDLLLAGLRKEQALARYVREIRRAGEQSAALIAQLLALAGGNTPSPCPMSWEEVISGMLNLVARLIGEHIELVTEFPAHAAKVQMDPGRMRQIVLNLVLNARDAMPEGGRIILAVKRLESSEAKESFPSVELSVTDTGLGMDAETRSRVFEPFFTTKANGRGHGLGLATVRRMVEESGGQVEIFSRPANGTRVSIYLPPVSGGSPERSQ
jgi:signal transduction histidine kinase